MTEASKANASDAAEDTAVALDGETVVSVSIEKELSQYREYVSAAAQRRDGRMFFNRSESHAAVVVEYLFRSAKAEVNILTERLHLPVYGGEGVIQAATQFLNDNLGARLRIISETGLGRHPLLVALAEAGAGDRVEVSVLNGEVARKTPFHFAVADGSAFRFESDKESMSAMVKFGDAKFGSQLNQTFESLQRNAI